ncbi:MAG TPA: NADH-quinone oxidoreductase subunit C [Thermoanaerobaculia bacterium]|nr:NADH-quinone oxidoreductase subunit C [Thermoanaerobaculia bacterium]
MADETTRPPDGDAGAAPPKAAPAAAAHKPPPPKKVEATDASAHPWVASIRSAFPDAVVSAKEFARQVTVVVRRERIGHVARHLKDVEDFRYCVDVTAVDWRDRQPRFDVVYHFYSFTKNDRIRVKCAVGDGEEVPSISEIFLAANWPERETWDMFGIPFTGHPDLRRILTWEGFRGFPLRKDFPLEGVDTGAAIYPEEWPEGGGPAADDPNRKAVS